MSQTKKTEFCDWTLQQLEDAFCLRDDDQHAPMRDWLQSAPTTDERTLADIELLRAKLDRHARGWNEEELKTFFIGPLLTLVNFDGAQYGAFADRTLSAVVDNDELSGIVDGMIARGRYEPVAPYFFLQQYDSEAGSDSDSAAQVLAEMLVARQLNAYPQTIHGCYVIGRQWFFLTLDATEFVYTISPSFDASSTDITNIFAMLTKLKGWIIQQVEAAMRS